MSAPFRDCAPELAAAGWPVGPCHGKVPLTAHGHADFTTDAEQVARWAKRYPQANIGARVPASMIVIDVDPRNGGEQSLGLLEAAHGQIPETLRSFTGGGGMHLFFLRPAGALRNGAHKLGPGLDVKLGARGYVILPESIHPETRRAYRWEDADAQIVRLPGWLTALLRPEPARPAPQRSTVQLDGERPGDLLGDRLSWAQILEPAGWVQVGQRGEVTYWRRPGKAGGVSATVNGLGTDRLHVFTSSAAPFEPDTSYSKFGAWTQLHADGDFREAARRLRRGVVA